MENIKNSNNQKTYTYDGLTLTTIEWAEYTGYSVQTMYNRFRRFPDDLEYCITAPLHEVKNKTRLLKYTIDNVTKTMDEWLDYFNVPKQLSLRVRIRSRIRIRIMVGINIYDAFTEPPRKYNKS